MTISQGLMLGQAETLQSDLSYAADCGFDHVELNMETGFARGTLDPSRVATLADDHDLDVVVHLPYRIDACSPHEHAREGACRELEATLDTAAEFGADRAVMHADTFGYPDVWDKDHIQSVIVEVADRIATYGTTHGIDVAVENLKGAFYDVYNYSEVADRSEASLCLDTGHAAVSGMSVQEQAEWLRTHADEVTHLHLNDTRHLDDDEHLPVGLGTLEFPVLASVIREIGWKGTATHEVWAPGDLTEPATAGKQVFTRYLADGA